MANISGSGVVHNSKEILQHVECKTVSYFMIALC